MRSPALWLVTGLYAFQLGACFRAHQYPQVAILGGYVIASLGLIWSMS